MGYIKPHWKTSRWSSFSALAAGGRPPGRPPTVKFLTVGSQRSTVPIQRVNALWPVDRSVDRPCLTVDRSVDRPNPRVGCLQSVDRPKWLTKRARLVHVGRPVRSTDSGSGRPTLDPVDRPGRPPEPGRLGSGSEN